MIEQFSDKHPLGKGEVVSSILTGSTINAHEIRAFDAPEMFHMATRDATKREHDSSTRGKSVEFVQAAFALCKWAKGKPWDVRMNVMIAVRELRLLVRYDCPAMRSVALRALARLQT